MWRKDPGDLTAASRNLGCPCSFSLSLSPSLYIPCSLAFSLSLSLPPWLQAGLRESRLKIGRRIDPNTNMRIASVLSRRHLGALQALHALIMQSCAPLGCQYLRRFLGGWLRPLGFRELRIVFILLLLCGLYGLFTAPLVAA